MTTRTTIAALTLLVAVARADCPPRGDGGDPDLNELKNRTDAPRSTLAMTVPEILTLRHVATRAARRRWSRADTHLVATSEGAAVTVEGYVSSAREEGPESANCHGDDHDVHVFLVDATSDPRGRSVVVEITPRVRHQSWTIAAVRSLARTRSRVRFTGWLMYDQEHGDEVGRSRGTSWEIHPVTRVEVFRDGTWSDL